MAVELAGVYNGSEFTIPAGTMVNPVYRRPNGSIYAEGGVRTIRESLHTTFRLLPTDGRFRTFIERNTNNGTAFAIALFENPVRTSRGVAIGCVVDLMRVEKDLPF
jgi:hypothetical protein